MESRDGSDSLSVRMGGWHEGWTLPHSQHALEHGHPFMGEHTAVALGPTGSAAGTRRAHQPQEQDLLCKDHSHKHRQLRWRWQHAPFMQLLITNIAITIAVNTTMSSQVCPPTTVVMCAGPCIHSAPTGRENRIDDAPLPLCSMLSLVEEAQGATQTFLPVIESMSADCIRYASCLNTSTSSVWGRAFTTNTPPTTMGDYSRQQKLQQQQLVQQLVQHVAPTVFPKCSSATRFLPDPIPFMTQMRPPPLRGAVITASTAPTTTTKTKTAMNTTVTMIATTVGDSQEHTALKARVHVFPTDRGPIRAQLETHKGGRHLWRRVASTDSTPRPMTIPTKTDAGTRQPASGRIAVDAEMTRAEQEGPGSGLCSRRSPISTGTPTTPATTHTTAITRMTKATVQAHEPPVVPSARRHTASDSDVLGAQYEGGHSSGWCPPAGVSVAWRTSMDSCVAPPATARTLDGILVVLSPAFLSALILLVAQLPSNYSPTSKPLCRSKRRRLLRRMQRALFAVMVVLGCSVQSVDRMDAVSATATTTQDQQHPLSVPPSWNVISSAVRNCFAGDAYELCRIVIRADEQSFSSTSAIDYDDHGEFVPVHIPAQYDIHLISTTTTTSATTMCDLNDARATSSFFVLHNGARLSVDTEIEAMFARWIAVATAPRARNSGAERRLAPLVAPTVHVLALYESTCAIQAPPTSDLRCWGQNYIGELGQGDNSTRGDSPWEMGANLSAVNLGTGLTPRPNVSTTSSGLFSCYVLDPTGSVKCFGWGGEGELGYGDTDSRGDNPGEMGDALPVVDVGSSPLPILQLAQGGLHSCVLFAQALRIKCWGHNFFGQLGYEDTNARGDGAGEMGGSLPFVELGLGLGVVELIMGFDCTCSRLNDTSQGGLKCWGRNTFGQLGYGDVDDRGDDASEMGGALPIVNVSSTGHVHVTQGDGGSDHTCILLNSSAVKCFGRGSDGALGYGDTADRGNDPGEMGDSLPEVDVIGSATGVQVVRVQCGAAHSCALISDGSMKCWGNGLYGQLGQENSSSIGDGPGEMGDSLPVIQLGGHAVVSASLGGYHTCVRLNDSSVKCFGDNQYGQLGQGDTDNRGNNIGEMGSSLPVVDIGPVVTSVPTAAPTPTPTPHPTLPLLAPVVQVIALDESTCSILAPPTSDLRCWGRNNMGQLGQGDVVDRGGSPMQMGANLSAVNLGAGLTPRLNITTTSMSWHSCLVLDPTGSVKCFGWGGEGQLGYGDTDNRGDNLGELGDALPAVNLGTALPPILQLAQGGFHNCVLFAQALRIKCWGRNSDGQLGYEDTNARGDGAGEMGNLLPFVDLGPALGVLQLIMGRYHTCSRLNDTSQGGLKCWGRNSDGQLGYGDTNNRGDGASEMGGALPIVNVSSTGLVHVTQGDGGWFHTCVLLNSRAR